ncbi:hypothetical protein PROFUN_12330 [Planoprotostelium fungivorum]|uniref:Uncharacterized protein n=1 Tax=Planoprotostelium fungivorum TaxID=1890364 RepID=A0A2P6N9C9_9EUKA|nr:hypothetical protein PROFUN_12330 [Planoprotostelium fungivorum]
MNVRKDEGEPTLGRACCYLEKWLDGSSSNGGIQTKDLEQSQNKTNKPTLERRCYLNSPASPDALAERIWRREVNVLRELYPRYSTPALASEETARDEKVEVEVDRTNEECPHDNLMAEAGEEGFSNYRVVNRHFQLNTQASTSPSPNMPPKAFETPADLAQAAKDYGRDTQREQMSYITQTGSAGQKAFLREEGLSTSNINKAFLDAAKDILKNN